MSVKQDHLMLSLSLFKNEMKCMEMPMLMCEYFIQQYRWQFSVFLHNLYSGTRTEK